MILSIDLGGTNVRIAQVENGRCLNKTSVACPAQQDASAIIGLLIQLIKDSMNEQVKGIGIGVPSIADPEKGIVYNVTNISSWKEIHLKEILTSEFALPVAINNDSNCFTLGVKNYGEGRAFANMVGMTIGTGIGAGVIINHHLYGANIWEQARWELFLIWMPTLSTIAAATSFGSTTPPEPKLPEKPAWENRARWKSGKSSAAIWAI